MTILQKFADPEIFKTMTMGEKMTASLYTTVLGMLITFTALLIIWGLILVMSNVIRSVENRGKKETLSAPVVEPVAPAVVVAEEEDEELVAVITAAIAASMNTSIQSIVVSNIVRQTDATPTWSKVGRSDLMTNRF